MATTKLEITKENITELEPGDLVEFTRGLYCHWAVYKGDEKVIHLSGADGEKNAKTAHVREDDFWFVKGDSQAFRNNSNDEKRKPLEKREIVRRGLSKIGEGNYNLMLNNCEHFANWCRYDTEESGQVQTFITGVVQFVTEVASYMKDSENRERNLKKKVME